MPGLKGFLIVRAKLPHLTNYPLGSAPSWLEQMAAASAVRPVSFPEEEIGYGRKPIAARKKVPSDRPPQ